ncbi:MAG: MFS transporter [Deltaproteobacteria bacterium]|nr:MAG: MFS transporter [Deltaproteobacteria bacterium]
MEPASTEIYKKIGPGERAFLTVILITGVFMAILDTTVVEVILPKIMAPLSTDIYGVQWVVTIYMIAAATGLLMVESASKAIGIKRIFLMGLILFTFGSFLCARANSLAEMISFRAFQGLGEAFLVASAETILFTIYPPEKRGFAMGVYSLAVSFSPALGPTLGGYITEHLTWRYVFYINIPIGILDIVASAVFIPKIIEKRVMVRFNYISFLFISLATISLLTLLSKGQEKGWFQSMFIVRLFFVSSISFCIYFISEIISGHSLIDFSIFRIKEFRTAIGVYFFILGLSMYQVFYLCPQYYERLRFLTTYQTGLHLMPAALCIAFFSIISGIMSDKIGPERVLVITVILYLPSVYLVLPHLNYYTPKAKSIIMIMIWGVSVGMFFAPITTLALKKLGEKTNLGVSLMHYARFVGGSFGTALATNKLQKSMAFHYDEISALQSRELYYVKQFIIKWYYLTAKHFSPEIALKKSKALLGYATNLQAMSYAFQDTFRESGIYAVIGCLFLALFFWEEHYGSRRNALDPTREGEAAA